MAKPIVFVDADGKRRTLRMTSFTDEQRDYIAVHVAALNSARIGNTPIDQATVRWLQGIGLGLQERLAELGLIPSPEPTTIREFLANRLAAYKVKVKAEQASADTLRTKQNAVDAALDFFVVKEKLRRIGDITEAHATEFRDWLLVSGGRPVKKCGTETIVKERKGLSEATARLRCRHISEFLSYAVRKRLLASNPFKGDSPVPTTGLATTNERIVTTDEAKRIWDELPSLEWRILFGLSRWGGLRVGSEPRKLTFGDINFDREEMLIHSVKTAHHGPEHATRLIPFYGHCPWLWDAIRERFDSAEAGETFVLPMLVGRTDASLRKTLLRAIDRAGVQRWADLWRTLRRTCHNELLEMGLSAKSVSYWQGNSERTAIKHYAHVTPADITRARGVRLNNSPERTVETAANQTVDV